MTPGLSSELGVLLLQARATPAERAALITALGTPAAAAATTLAGLPCQPLLAALQTRARAARTKAGRP